jgi:hypothetical protein
VPGHHENSGPNDAADAAGNEVEGGQRALESPDLAVALLALRGFVRQFRGGFASPDICHPGLQLHFRRPVPQDHNACDQLWARLAVDFYPTCAGGFDCDVILAARRRRDDRSLTFRFGT